MKKYSDEEVMKIIDSVAFPKGLSIFQTVKLVYWSLFERKKLYKFCEEIEKGKPPYYSLKEVEKQFQKKHFDK